MVGSQAAAVLLPAAASTTHSPAGTPSPTSPTSTPWPAELELLGEGAYTLEPALDEVLEEGLRRMRQRGAWKVWQWPPDGAVFFDASSFWEYMQVRRGAAASGRRRPRLLAGARPRPPHVPALPPLPPRAQA
jgi:hypothetical protein